MKFMILIGAVALALVVGGIAYEHMLWRECLQTNSWFFCLRVLA